MKFINRDGLGEFIDDDNKLVAWGGKDTWQHAWIPEARPLSKDGVAGDAATTKIMEVVPPNMLAFVKNGQGDFTSQLEIINVASTPIVYKVERKIPLKKKNNKTTTTLIHIFVLQVKTTSPDVFRVRPHVGLIQPDSSATIRGGKLSTKLNR